MNRDQTAETLSCQELSHGNGHQGRLWRLFRERKLTGIAARRIEHTEVAPHIRSSPQVLQGFFQDRRSHNVTRDDEAVVHPPSLAPGRRDARAPEVGEMARDLRLTDAKDLDEIADAYLSIGDEVEQAKPRGVGQGAKQKIDRERFAFSWHGERYYIWLDGYNQAGVGSTHMHERIYALRGGRVRAPRLLHGQVLGAH